MVSGSISLPSPGFFSSFPHGTCPLSVANSYLALDRGRPGFRQDFSCPAVLRYCTGKTTVFRVRGFHPLCQAFPKPFRYTFALSLAVRKPVQPYNPRLTGLGSSNFARHYFRNLFWCLFLELLRWFSSLSIALPLYFIQERNDRIAPIGLPHSAISGSQDMCSSPKLFAAYHGLLRRLAPRHPP